MDDFHEDDVPRPEQDIDEDEGTPEVFNRVRININLLVPEKLDSFTVLMALENLQAPFQNVGIEMRELAVSADD
jgi:hypothetical protein